MLISFTTTIMSSNPSSDASPEWSSKRREITYQEARTVLDTQQATIESIDTKALRTARLPAIVIGVLISLVEALGVSVSVPFAYAGALTLLLSFASSIATYNASNLTLGPNRRYLTQIIDGDFEISETEPGDEIETAWEVDLL